MNFGRTVTAIFFKDLLSEFRLRRTAVSMIVLAVLISWIFRTVSASSPAEAGGIAAAVLLVAVLFAGIITSEKIFALEQENECISALLLSPADAGDVYIGKLLVSIAILCIFEVVAAPAVLLFFNINPAGRWVGLVVILFLVNLAVSAVGVTLASALQGTKAAGGLLSILIMAALSPVMIAAASALSSVFSGSFYQQGVSSSLIPAADFTKAVGFLIAVDAIFVTVCWFLFGFVFCQQES